MYRLVISLFQCDLTQDRSRCPYSDSQNGLCETSTPSKALVRQISLTFWIHIGNHDSKVDPYRRHEEQPQQAQGPWTVKRGH